MKNLATVATRALGRSKVMLIKHAPAIMTYGGMILTGVGIYLFCKASMQLSEKVDIHDERMEEIERMAEEMDLEPKEKGRMIRKERMDFTWEVAKLYGPAASTTFCGFMLVLGGHHMISKRSAAISAAYKALEEGYSQYRQRVRDDLGADYDRKYLYGLKETTAEITVKDENGNEKKMEADIYVPHEKTSEEIIRNASPYARFFDEFSTQWTRNPEYNLMFLNAQQNYANDKLHAQGHLFLNEVYEMLGLPHTQAGSVVGWVMNKGGDNCVDFGIYDLHDQIKRAFVNGFEPSILLDFNVDGVIYDLI